MAEKPALPSHRGLLITVSTLVALVLICSLNLWLIREAIHHANPFGPITGAFHGHFTTTSRIILFGVTVTLTLLGAGVGYNVSHGLNMRSRLPVAIAVGGLLAGLLAYPLLVIRHLNP